MVFPLLNLFLIQKECLIKIGLQEVQDLITQLCKFETHHSMGGGNGHLRGGAIRGGGGPPREGGGIS